MLLYDFYFATRLRSIQVVAHFARMCGLHPLQDGSLTGNGIKLYGSGLFPALTDEIQKAFGFNPTVALAFRASWSSGFETEASCPQLQGVALMFSAIFELFNEEPGNAVLLDGNDEYTIMVRLGEIVKLSPGYGDRVLKDVKANVSFPLLIEKLVSPLDHRKI